MAKKEIGKILATGSPKQRIILLAEDIARSKYFEDKLLTDSDFKKLSDSFKKPNEIRLFNEFRELDETITNALINLEGLRFEVLMKYSNLRGYILVWNSVENAELLVNSVLHEIKDLKERERIAKEGANGAKLLFTKTEVDTEGYIDIKVNFRNDNQIEDSYQRHNLMYVMNNVKKEVEEAVVKYISWEKAIIDFMEERGFNVKTYKEQIEKMTAQVYTPIIGWGKYSGKLNIEDSYPRLESIIEKYAICPDIEELKVDEAQYDWFKKYFLEREKGNYPDELRGINKKV